MSNTVIVTGGAGYIGSHVCKMLKSKGYIPVAVDDLSNGFVDLVKWGELERADIRDSKKITQIIQKHRPVAVMHFAASISVGESVKNPYKYYQNNTATALEFFKTLVNNNVKNIIFSSTAGVYGIPQKNQLDEEHPKNPINPYGRSKLFTENILKDFEDAYGLKSIVLRYFNAAGADIESETGCSQNFTTNLIPIITKVLVGEQKELSIYGSDYDTEDGTCVRDFIHVTDLASAHVMALEYLLDKQESDVFNLGTGRGYSVRNVVERTKELTGINFNFNYAERREGDPAVLVANSDRAQRVLNWKPEYSNLDTIIKTAWQWKQTNMRGK